MKHIIVTGASGYVGKHLLHSFLRNDYKKPEPADTQASTTTDDQLSVQYKIYALYGSHVDFDQAVQEYASHSAAATTSTCQIQTFALDLTDATAIDTWVETNLAQVQMMDACIHLAALSNPGKCQQEPALARAVNIPQHFFQVLYEQKHCQSVIALSTDHVYPGTNPPYKEEENNDDLLKPINMYGTTKYEMEQFLLSLRDSGLQKVKNQSGPQQIRPPGQVILLRSSIILGAKSPIATEQSKSTFLHFIASRKDQETSFWTDEKRNVISVRDVVAILRWFLLDPPCDDDETSRSGVYNMGGPESLSRYDMAKSVFEYLGYDKHYIVPQEKGQPDPNAAAPAKGAPSPLDISMDSTKLVKRTGLQFSGFAYILQVTFGNA